MKEEPKQENCCTPVGQIKRYVDCVGCDRNPKHQTLSGFKEGGPDVDLEWLNQNSNVDNRETLEDAANNWIKSTSEFLSVKNGFIEGAKWQAERMYSEEEVCEFVEWLNLHYRALEHTISFKDARGTKKLLQQFKKQNNEQ